jgi:hypothetical protein
MDILEFAAWHIPNGRMGLGLSQTISIREWFGLSHGRASLRAADLPSSRFMIVEMGAFLPLARLDL